MTSLSSAGLEIENAAVSGTLTFHPLSSRIASMFSVPSSRRVLSV